MFRWAGYSAGDRLRALASPVGHPQYDGMHEYPLPASFAVMPQNQSQGDIPKIAIATPG